MTVDPTIVPFDPQAEAPQAVFHCGNVGDSEIVALFNPSTPDRTEAIKGLAPSPLPFLVNSFQLLELFRVERTGIACNTMHYWYDRALSAHGAPRCLSLPVAHMIRLTAETLQRLGVHRAGLLATTGTVSTGIYQKAIRQLGLSLLCPQQKTLPLEPQLCDAKGRLHRKIYEERGVSSQGVINAVNFPNLAPFLERLLGEQEGLVMEAIYGVFGIKAGYKNGVAEALMRRAAERLVHRSCDALVLGCTEIPLVLQGSRVSFGGMEVRLVDPTRVVANALSEKSLRRVGIAGGMGPAATIDMLSKLGLDKEGLAFLESIYRESIAVLHRSGTQVVADSDHPKFLFIRTQAPETFAEHLRQASVSAISFTDMRRKVPSALQGLPLLSDLSALVNAGLAAKDAARKLVN